jgi:hypothetical protein
LQKLDRLSISKSSNYYAYALLEVGWQNIILSKLQFKDVSFQTYAINPCTKAYVLVSGAGLLNDAFCGSFLNQKDGDVLSGTITGKTEQTRKKINTNKNKSRLMFALGLSQTDKINQVIQYLNLFYAFLT